MSYRMLWPRVPSDKPVICTPFQHPDAASGRCVDDADGCLKLSSESCSLCYNLYHVTIDCPSYQAEEELPNPN